MDVHGSLIGKHGSVGIRNRHSCEQSASPFGQAEGLEAAPLPSFIVLSR